MGVAGCLLHRSFFFAPTSTERKLSFVASGYFMGAIELNACPFKQASRKDLLRLLLVGHNGPAMAVGFAGMSLVYSALGFGEIYKPI